MAWRAVGWLAEQGLVQARHGIIPEVNDLVQSTKVLALVRLTPVP